MYHAGFSQCFWRLPSYIARSGDLLNYVVSRAALLPSLWVCGYLFLGARTSVCSSVIRNFGILPSLSAEGAVRLRFFLGNTFRTRFFFSLGIFSLAIFEFLRVFFVQLPLQYSPDSHRRNKPIPADLRKLFFFIPIGRKL